MNEAKGIGTQIPLAFNKFEHVDFELYIAGPNQQAVQYLQNVVAGLECSNVYLWGQAGTGKSHLLQALCTAAAKTNLKVAYIPLMDADSLSPQMLEGLAQLSLVCLDDIDAIAGRADWEQAIFHFYNQLRDARVPLLVTGRYSPKGSPVHLADLKSRLGWDHVFHLQHLDDENSRRALQHRARSRGFDLPDEVADYLLKRVARDMPSLFQMLDRLDNASLVAKKKLTVPFVKSLLD